MDLGHGDNLDERVGNTVEVEKLRRGRVFLGFGRVLFELDLLDANANLVSIFRRNTVVAEEVDVAGPCKGFCPSVSRPDLLIARA